MITSQPNMGHKYPPKQQVGKKYPVQSNQSNKIHQNTFTNACVAQTAEQLPCKQTVEGATPSIDSNTIANKGNDIHRRDTRTGTPSSSLESCNDRYITTKHRVIHKQSSGAGLANNRAKWREMQTNTILQLNKVGNNYPSTK